MAPQMISTAICVYIDHPYRTLQSDKAGDSRETHIFSRKVYERILVRWKPDILFELSLKAVHSDELIHLQLNKCSPVVFRGAFDLRLILCGVSDILILKTEVSICNLL